MKEELCNPWNALFLVSKHRAWSKKPSLTEKVDNRCHDTHHIQLGFEFCRASYGKESLVVLKYIYSIPFRRKQNYLSKSLKLGPRCRLRRQAKQTHTKRTFSSEWISFATKGNVLFVASIQFRNEKSPQTCKNKSGKHTRRINMHGDKGWGEDSRL